MPEIKLKHVVSCTSEDNSFPADNLLATESFKKWKCKQGEKQAAIILQFEQSSNIQSLDIGNEGSAFVEVLVGRSADKEDNYDVLLSSQSFLSPAESRQENNFNRVRIFNREQLEKNVLDQKWDRIKIVCSQPYNKNIGYGLSFVRVHAPSSSTTGDKPTTNFGKFTLKSEDETDKTIATGSLFKQRSKTNDENETKSVPSVIKQAANEYVQKQNASVAREKTSQNIVSTSSKNEDRARKPIQSEERSRKTSPKLERKTSPKQRKMSPPTQVERKINSAADSTTKKQIKYVDFNKLLDGVVFVLSGFVNPFRAELRDKAMQMGAQYKGDWGKGCTHLICAFTNTPKYNQVKGKGKIVKKEWIIDSFKEKKRLPWKKYSFEKQTKSDSDDDFELVAKSDDAPTASSRQQSASPPPKKPKADEVKRNVYDASTDEIDTDDEIERIKAKTKNKDGKPSTSTKANDMQASGGTKRQSPVDIASTAPKSPSDAPSSVPKTSTTDKNVSNDNEDLPQLPTFFNSMRFLLYGDFTAAERKQLNRYIVAFDGRVEQYMSPNVTHVLTHKSWSDDFDEALKENARIFFVEPEWVIECGRKGSYVDASRFVIVKK